jgi:hypothetical protein
VAIAGFGTFKVSKRKARTGRNPQTGAQIKVGAKSVTKFTAGKVLKEAVAQVSKRNIVVKRLSKVVLTRQGRSVFRGLG